MIRSSVEYASIVYHSLIPQYISEKLESVQRQAIKIIYGFNSDYNTLVQDGIIEPLADRREKNILKFALKVSNSDRFGPIWFRKNPNISRELRPGIRQTFIEQFCRTERGRNNPLNYLTRVLNEHMSSNE